MHRISDSHPLEFRRQMVELVRSGRTPEEMTREFEPTAQSIMICQAKRDAGKRSDGAQYTSLASPTAARTQASDR